MDGKLAQSFLKRYFNDSSPYLENFFSIEQERAWKISRNTLPLLKKINSLTKLGKKFRGGLVLLGYQATGGKNRQAILPASLFIELFQAGVLIHDDIIDCDDFRRGLKTIHKQYSDLAKANGFFTKAKHYGESMAITAGDIAMFYSFQMLAAAKFKPADVVKALSLFSTHVARVGYGQYLDISVTGEDDRTIKEIRTVMQLKTSDYTTSLPLLVGASLAGCRKQETIKAIRQYASHLGMIFQIKDDLLGIFGNQEKTGKPVGTDLRERKQTLIIEHLKSHGNIHQLGVLSRLFGKKEISEEDLTDFKQVLEEVDTQAYLNRLAMKHLRLAKQQIPTITKSSRIGQIFESFLFFALERNV